MLQASTTKVRNMNAKNKFTYALCGIFMYIALLNLHKAYVGKEEYIKMLDENWTDPNYAVPIALLLFVVSQWEYRKT